MPEEQKAAVAQQAPEPAKQNQPKMVLEADLLRFKKGAEAREKRLKEELQTTSAKLRDFEAKSILGGLNVPDDGDVGVVKKYLIDKARELEEQRHKLDEELTSFKEREREVRVKDVAMKYGLNTEELSGEEDVDSAALRLHAERLAKENAELKLKTTTPQQPVYESGSPAVVRKNVFDMNDQEFAQYENELKAKALSR